MNIFDKLGYSQTQKKLLASIYAGHNITRGVLASRTNLSMLTVTKAVARFIEDNVLIEKSKLESTGGRKPNTLALRPDLAYAICVDIGVASTRIALVSIGGTIIDIHEESYYAGSLPTTALPKEALRDLLRKLYQKWSAYEILGIDIAVSGQVDSAAGVILYCHNLQGYNGVNLVEYLKAYFDVPILLDTCARVMALSEHHNGAGRDIENMVYITVGYSINAGIILNGKLFTGSNNVSGEIGHMFVRESEALCTCGNTGCLETIASVPSILSTISQRLSFAGAYSSIHNPVFVSLQSAAAALEQGDKLVYGTIVDAGQALGRAVSMLVNMLNPEMIILGGWAVDYFGLLVQEAAHFVRANALTVNQKNLRIVKGMDTHACTLVGSVVHIANHCLQ